MTSLHAVPDQDVTERDSWLAVLDQCMTLRAVTCMNVNQLFDEALSNIVLLARDRLLVLQREERDA